MKVVVLVGSVIVATANLSISAASSDFARGTPIEIVDGARAQRISVPADVYTWTVREDLGDLRVLNGAGDELPYTVRTPPDAQEDTAWVPLPIFPLPADEPGGQGSTNVNIELGTGGAVVAVHGAVQRADAHRYLIDATGYKEPIHELEVSWDSSSADFLAQARVEASDDLNEWRTVVPSTTLTSLETNGQWVKLDRIRLDGSRSRYLKVVFESDALRISGVRARSKAAKAPVRMWTTLAGTPLDGGFDFDTGGHFPVDRVFVELDRPTYLTEANLYSRATDDGVWRDLGKHRFYRADSADTSVTSDPVAYPVTHARYWRVVTRPAAERPQLRIGWLPHEVVFLPQGNAPFVLVYGRAALERREWPIADLIQRLDKGAATDTLPIASIGQPATTGGPGRLVPPPAPIDWRTVALWAVLVLGVIVVAALAIRLVRTGNPRIDP